MIKLSSKQFLILSLVLSCLTFLVVAKTTLASPTPGPGGRNWGCGYFTNACKDPVGGYRYYEVINNGLNSSAETKGGFISFIKDKLNNGAARDKTGAAFIIQMMRGGTNHSRPSGAEIADWENRINDPSITVAVEQYDYVWNSGWMQGFRDDDAFYPSRDRRTSLVFRHNGTVVFVLKYDCANPVNDLPGLPTPSPNTMEIRGFKVDDTFGVSAPTNDAVISYVCCSRPPMPFPPPDNTPATTTNNPYFFSNLPLGDHEVRAAAVPGWTVAGYSMCFNRTNCHTPGDPGFAIIPGTAVNPWASRPAGFDTTGGYVDLWWHYASIPVPATTFTCTNVVPDPNPVEAGAPFKLRVNIHSSGGIPMSYTFTATLSAPSPPNPSAMTGTPASFAGSVAKDGTTTATFEPLTVTAAGNYEGNIAVSFSPGGASINCPFNSSGSNPTCTANCSQFVAVTKPYFQVRNGDAAAGMGSALGSSCTGWGTGGLGTLTAWNQLLNPPPANNPNVGAGTNLAAFALDIIDGFASAQTPSGSSVPKDLSFANSAGTFGGSFGGGINCPDDYFSTGNGIATSAGGTVNVSSLTTSEKYVGNVTVKGGNISPGEHIALYIDGDAYIDGSGIKAIRFVGGPWPINQIPSFYLIVKGNIYIDAEVDQLDGVYVAQPLSDGSKGLIYTCSSGFLAPTKPQLNGVCKNKVLTVNGAFIARELKLYRSFGSLSTSGPAELFNFTPATWLVAPAPLGGSGFGGGYDAITSLPPIL